MPPVQTMGSVFPYVPPFLNDCATHTLAHLRSTVLYSILTCRDATDDSLNTSYYSTVSLEARAP